MTEENYEHLEIPVIVDDGYYYRPIKCVVAGCDRSIGITIKVEEDVEFPQKKDKVWLKKGKEYICIHGENSPHLKNCINTCSDYVDKYSKAFDIFIKEIESGVITSDIDKLMGMNSNGFGSVNCSFT